MQETLEPALPDELIEKAHSVLKLALENDVSLVTAESCTGGLLASLLTDIEGYGRVFERGIVCYSSKAKCDLLDVAEETVDTCGAVSRQVACAMADGALRRSSGDIAVSITGFAGPGGEDDEEGLVHFACARHGSSPAHREEHFGPIGRAGVRRAAIEVALEMIEEAIRA